MTRKKPQTITTDKPSVQLPKHLSINDAIARVIVFEERLSDFLAKIRGEDTGSDPKCDETNPCLIQVLDNTPGKLNNSVEHMHETLDTINECLYE